MTTALEYRALIRRVQKEPVTDDLSDAILIAFGWSRPAAGMTGLVNPRGGYETSPASPLEDLSAAVALLPPGWRVNVRQLPTGWMVAAAHQDYRAAIDFADQEPVARTLIALGATANILEQEP